MKKILCLVAFFSFTYQLSAQAFKFGIQASPVVSWMHSNNKQVSTTGANLGIDFGLIGEYYFSENENYAFTMGLNYVLGKGGGLKYDDAGRILPDTDYSNELLAVIPRDSGSTSVTFPANTTFKSRLNYLRIPLGFKMRTNELGNSYLRAFAQLPVLGIDIATSARSDIKLDNDTEFKKEVTYRDFLPLGLTVGGGAGVEWFPNDSELAFVMGVYYNGGLIDITQDELKRKGTTSDVTIRLAVMF
jgi:hypothetical protein